MKPQFCPECGTAIDDEGICTNPACSNHTPKSSKSEFSFKNVIKPPVFKEKGKLIVPDCIQSDNNELPIKQYDIARLQTLIKGARAEGRLQVTNKRVLFRSVGGSIIGPTSLEYEFSIEEVAGVEIRKEARFNFSSAFLLAALTALIVALFNSIFAPIYNKDFLGGVFTLILAVASVVLFFVLQNKHILRHIVFSFFLSALPIDKVLLKTIFGTPNALQNLCCVVVLIVFLISYIYLAFAPNLVVNIKTKGGTPSVEIRKKDGILSFHHNDYTGFAQVMPGPDTDLAMHELGAVIREVQQTGTYVEQ